MVRFLDTVLFLVGSAYFVAGSYDDSDEAAGTVGECVLWVYVCMLWLVCIFMFVYLMCIVN